MRMYLKAVGRRRVDDAWAEPEIKNINIFPFLLPGVYMMTHDTSVRNNMEKLKEKETSVNVVIKHPARGRGGK